MKSNVPVLYPNQEVAVAVTEYAATNSGGLPAHLHEYHDHILNNEEKSNLTISKYQSRAMMWLAKTAGVKRVLEIGVYIGYSSLMWADVVGPEGKVTGLEFNPAYAEKAKAAYAKYGAKNIEVLVGDALEQLPQLSPDEPYDLIFIDAQKSGYPAYLRTILERSLPGSGNKRLLRVGGLIVADNVLRRGLVAVNNEANPAYEGEAKRVQASGYWSEDDIKCLDEFNRLMASEERIDTFLMPLFDGVGLGRLVD